MNSISLFSRRCLLLIFPFCFIIQEVQAQLAITWEAQHTGGDYDFRPADISALPDGSGYLIVGKYDASLYINTDSEYGVVAKVDHRGELVWYKKIGTSGKQGFFNAFISDGGDFIVTGQKKQENGLWEDWLVRLDASGAVIWETTIGDFYQSYSSPTLTELDNGDILLVSDSQPYSSTSNNAPKPLNIYRFNSDGNLLWTKKYSDSTAPIEAVSCLESSDGGYFIGGSFSGSDDDFTSANGYYDYLLVKLDAAGEMEWYRTYGGTHIETLTKMEMLPDGDLMMVGTSQSPIGGDVSAPKGNKDVWVIKAAANNGDLIWEKSFGGSQSESFVQAAVHPSGISYVVARSFSSDGDISNNNGQEISWIFKLDYTGNILAESNIDPHGSDVIKGVTTDADGRAVLVNNSFGSVFQVTDEPFIDLELDLANGLPAPVINSHYPVTATLTNRGNTMATGVTVDFPLPTGVEFEDGNAFELSQGAYAPFSDQIWEVGDILPGDTTVLTVNYLLLQNDPPAAFAEVAFANETDADSEPGNGLPPFRHEDDEANTDAEVSLPPSDLVIDNVIVSDSVITPSETFVVKFDAINLGPSPVDDWSVGFYFSDDEELSADDQLLETYDFSGPFVPGIELSVAFVPIPYPTFLGDYFILMKADYDDSISETDEGNNLYVQPLRIEDPNFCNINHVLSSQAEVNAFDCEIFNGVLTISGANITDLSPLANLQYVKLLVVQNNPVLTTLDGLQGLDSLGGSLHTIIKNNAQLTSVEALGNIIEGVTSELEIINNPNLTSLKGLEWVKSLYELKISGNHSLQNLEGLDSLKSAYILNISNNDNLINLDGLSALKSSNTFHVHHNPNLSNLESLSNLGHVGYSISIDNLPSLTSLAGLENIRPAYFLNVKDNVNLSECCGINPFISNLNSTQPFGEINLENNLPGCNSTLEILTSCLDCNKSMTIQSQAILDTFPSCDTIFGNLTLIYSGGSSIVDLSPLLGLKVVTGKLTLQSLFNLDNLNGLDSLQAVGELHIRSCSQLTTLDALQNLASADSVEIVSNNNLSVCCGLFPLLEGTPDLAARILSNETGCDNMAEIINGCLPSVDLELGINSPSTAPIYTSYPVTLTLQNTGTLPATGVRVEFKKPAGVVYTGGMEAIPSHGTFDTFGNEVWEVGTMEAGGEAELEVNYFLLQNDLPTVYAQVIATNEDDKDSTPGNGTPPFANEDDEASSATTPTDLPDFVLQNLVLQNNQIVTGENLDYSVEINNLESFTPNGSLDAQAWVSSDDILDGNDIPAGGFGIPLGSQQSFPYPIVHQPYMPLPTGDYFLFLKVDYQNNFAETDETNNLISAPFTILPNNTCIGDVTLTSQTEVDAFAGCPIIDGDLLIKSPNGPGGASSDITDLSPLLGLEQVTGFLILNNNAHLYNLYGLDSLNSIGGLTVVFSDSLNNLQALSGVSGELEYISILNNTSLSNFDGLEAITKVNHSLYIGENESLQNLNGLSNLDSAAINGLSYSFDITNNPSLTDIQGLQSLTYVGGTFYIGNNIVLESLDGLESLATVGGSFVLVDNIQIQDVSALTALTTVGENLPIQRNYQLADCCIFQNLLNGNGLSGTAFIADNLSGCNSIQEIIDSCTVIGDFIDLELALAQPNDNPAQWSSYSTTATLTNNGDAPATGIQVSFAKPAGVVYTGGSEANPSQGTFDIFGTEKWQVGSLAPGASATLEVSYFLLQPEPPVAYAQVTAANEEDADSTPGNGTPPTVNEDDEASTGEVAPPPIVCQGDVILESQAEVDAFSGCNVIEGSLIIRSPNGITGPSSDITDLSPLSSLTHIEAGIQVENNDLLFDLHGLENITHIGGSLVVIGCETLDNFNALSGITGSLESFFAWDNPDLANLNALMDISTFNAGFSLIRNASLTNLDGLSNINFVGGDFEINENVSLSSIQGLSSLTQIDRDLIIANNIALTTLDGLENLTSIGNFLVLAANDSLSDVGALSNLTSIGGTLYVAVNPMLSDCCIFKNLLNGGDIGGSITIEDNAPNCNSPAEILDACTSVGPDLELSMASPNPDPAIYTSTTIELTLTNTGGETATSITVDFPRPAGTVYSGGNEWSATQGTFNPFGNEQWTVGNLAAGETATLTVSYFLLSENALTPYAQVIAANETDVDSTPGNGTPPNPNEDDEATLTLNAFAAGGGVALQAQELIGRPVQLRAVNPNPVYHGKINVIIDSRVEGRYELECYDLFGRLAFLQKIELEERRNDVPLDVSRLESGTYYLNMPGENWRGMPLRFVVARW